MQELKVENQEEILRGYSRRRRYNWGKLQAVIKRFMESADAVRELKFDTGEYANLQSARAAVCKAVKRSGYDIRTLIKDDHFYILKGVYINENN